MDHAITVRDVLIPVLVIAAFVGVVAVFIALVTIFNPFGSGH
jgi:hypothetical protein